MKILFISNLFPPHSIGGYEIACFDTYNLFKNNNIDCAVLTSNYCKENITINKESDKKENIFRDLIMHTDFKNNLLCKPYNYVESYNFKVTTDFIKNYKPDIVYYWNIWGLSSKIIECIDLQKRVFHIMDFSILNYNFSIANFLKYIFLKNRPRPIILKNNISNIFFISKYVKFHFPKFNFKKSKILYPFLKQFHTGMKKHSYENKFENFKGVFLGQIEIHKGVLDLCNILNNINKYYAKKIIELHIYGNSLSGLDIQIRNSFDFVIFHNSKTRSEILHELKNYDFGFFPSIWEEPFGIAQIEMMASGLPVFTSAKGGSKEVLNKNNSFIYRDYVHLKELIINVLSDYQNKVQDIGMLASSNIEDNHNEIIYYNTIFQIFNNIIDENKL